MSPPRRRAARARLLPGAPLIDRALVQVEDADRPFLTRALRVPDRVTAHLLGDDAADPALVGLLTEPVPFAGEQSARLARALTAGQRLIYVREAGIGIGPSVAAAALQAIGRPVLGVDLARTAAGRDPEEAVAVLGREALLRGAGVVAGPVEALSEGHRRGAAAARRPAAAGGDRRNGHLGSELDRQRAAGHRRARRSARRSGSPCGQRNSAVARTGTQSVPPTVTVANSTSRRIPVHFVLGPGPGGAGRCGPRRPRPLLGTGATDRRRPPARGAGRRTPPAWSGWPAGSNRRSAGTTSCCRSRRAASCTIWPPGPGTGTRC